MKPSGQSWSIIIFCYNEAGTLASVIKSTEEFFERIQCDDGEIVIVDDGSTDNSKEVISDALKTYDNIRSMHHPRNLGIGRALRTGYSSVRNENVSAVPGDGQFDLMELVPFATIHTKSFVSFYREEHHVYNRLRRFITLFNKKLNAMLVGVQLRDVNWVKIYKRSELERLDLKMRSSLVESEICAKLLHDDNEVIETKSIYHPRKAGRSKGASLPIVVQAASEILKLVWVINLYRLRKRAR